MTYLSSAIAEHEIVDIVHAVEKSFDRTGNFSVRVLHTHTSRAYNA